MKDLRSKFMELIHNKKELEYADIRIQATKSEMIYMHDLSLKNTSKNNKTGYSIRVLVGGAWGLSHTNDFTEEALKITLEKAIASATIASKIQGENKIVLAPEKSYAGAYKTKLITDPLQVSIKEKVELMNEVNSILLSHSDIKQASFMLRSQNDYKLFASSLGSMLEIDTTFIEPSFTAYAVANNDMQSRSYADEGKATGWEYITGMNLREKALKIADEAIMKVKAEEAGEIRRRDLILDPIHLGLTMHESIGHPTELDRVHGWEADMAGLSFATQEKLGNFQYGSKLVNFVGDNTLEGGFATAGWDDDGVPGQRWHIIKEGKFVDYSSTRDVALKLKATSSPSLGMSRGSCRATYYNDFPMNRIPNLYLEPGKERLTPEELIADTKDGISIEGRGSFSIDQHRLNYQFGGDLFWEIKDGKKVKMLKNVLYKSNNPEFWNSVDAICDERFFKTFGVLNCGKGQPMQVARMTHGASPTRFKNIRVGGTK